MEISLDDFCNALAQEIGSVTWTVTDAAFKIKFDAAVNRVLEGIKAESAKVV